MVNAVVDLPSGQTIKRIQTGFLLEPFGWVAEWIVDTINAKPELLNNLLRLGRKRMHLIALAIAHYSGNVSGELSKTFLSG
jgi:hypothetical protein